MRTSSSSIIPVDPSAKPLPAPVRRALNVLISRGFTGEQVEAVEISKGLYSIRATVSDFTVTYDVDDLNTGEDI